MFKDIICKKQQQQKQQQHTNKQQQQNKHTLFIHFIDTFSQYLIDLFSLDQNL
jgi:hypothetical protein